MIEEILRMENITYQAGQEVMIDNLNLYMFGGEIMGLIATDAKGRDELISLICQNLPIRFGRVWFGGKLVNNYIHSDGSYNKVYVISEKSQLIEALSVEDNIFVMRKGFKKYVINNRVLRNQVKRLFEQMEVDVPLKRRVTELTVLERCMVELLKARLMGCRLIVLYNLSNFLSLHELKKFQDVILQYCGLGLSFLYVGNHHQEVFKISDRTALFEDGRIIKIFEKHDMNDEAIQPYIIPFESPEGKRRIPDGTGILRFDQVFTENLRGLSFSLRKGECLTLLDMDNRVLEDIQDILKKELEPSKGIVTVEDRVYKKDGGRDFLDSGIAVIPSDPTETFLFKEMNYMENLTFLLDRKLRASILKGSYIKSVHDEYMKLTGPCIDSRDIRFIDEKEKYGLVYYRIHLLHPKIAVCVQPMARGDMFCRRYVLERIRDLQKIGISVLILTSSLTDCLEVANRLLIVKDGTAAAEYPAEEFFRVAR